MTLVTDGPANVAGALIDTLIASNRGDRNAFTFGEKRYSFQDVAALMNRAGNMLKGMGLQRGAAVLVLLPGSPAFVASVLGAMKAGGVAVLGPQPVSDPALRACLAACAPSLVVIHQNDLDGARDALAASAARSIVVGGDGRDHPSFVDEIRRQSSWLAAETVGGDAVAWGAWTGAAIHRFTHAQLAALLDRSDGAPADATLPAHAAATIGMLRCFARGEPATLP
jgi:acyl-coenzyme A synthetase/AMP-(fatty) acid ligase